MRKKKELVEKVNLPSIEFDEEKKPVVITVEHTVTQDLQDIKTLLKSINESINKLTRVMNGGFPV